MSRLQHLLVIATLFVALPAAGQPAGLPPQLSRSVDRLFAPFATDTTPGYAVAVLKEGLPVYWRGYGMANLEEGSAITPATVFNVASLSKQFTAACIALLILDGKVRLDDTAASYVPVLAKYHRRDRAPILVKHLIYMTSGLPEYFTIQRKHGRSWGMNDVFTVDDAIEATISVDTLLFEPGTRWAYSNVNYMLLTRIVERVSGMRFADFVQERLFVPLKMRATHVNIDINRVVPRRAHAYNRRTGVDSESSGLGGSAGRSGWVTQPRLSPHYGGSGVFTTLEDLARWDRNFHTMQFGGQPFVELMLRPERFAHPKANDAFGLVHGEYRGLRTIWYEGGDAGVSSAYLRFPDERTTIIVLSNMGEGNSMRYARAVADLVLARSMR